MVHAGSFQRVVRVGSPAGSGTEDGSGLYKAVLQMMMVLMVAMGMERRGQFGGDLGGDICKAPRV